MSKAAFIGIDLGTTNSVVSVLKNKKLEVVEVTGEGKKLLRSAAMYRKGKEPMCGKVCLSNITYIRKGVVVTNSKRILGRKFDDPFVEKVKSSCYAKVVENEKGMAVFSIPNVEGYVAPEDVAALFLNKLYDSAIAKLDNVPVGGVTVTIPAAYSQEQKLATKRAIEKSKLPKNVKLQTEPSAAAIAYGLDTDYKNSTILVYDLGGGTFDVSIIQIKNGEEFSVLGTDGDIGIGGEAFDDRIVRALNQFFVEHSDEGVLPEEDAQDEFYYRAHALLRDMCREAKEALSSDGMDTVNIDITEFNSILRKYMPKEEDDGDDGDYSDVEVVETYSLTRKKFESLIKDDIERTVMITNRCIERTGLRKEDISVVVMVGGSSRIPFVKRRMEQEFGSGRVKYQINPDECVSMGAAMFASQKVHNRTTKDICVGASNHQYNVIIPKGTEYPTKTPGTQKFSLDRHNVGYIKCPVFEHDEEYRLLDNVVIDNEAIAGCEMDLLFKYKIDEEGICYLTVEDDDDHILLDNKPVSLCYDSADYCPEEDY